EPAMTPSPERPGYQSRSSLSVGRRVLYPFHSPFLFGSGRLVPSSAGGMIQSPAAWAWRAASKTALMFGDMGWTIATLYSGSVGNDLGGLGSYVTAPIWVRLMAGDRLHGGGV